MARSVRCPAIVLQTHDVGEADRFCILFTRDAGRVAARARGCRRMGSSMGAALLPLRESMVDLRQSGDAWHVTEARSLGNGEWSLEQYTNAIRGIELLLVLLEDEQPLHDMYDDLSQFLKACTHNEDPILPFTVRTLQHLGLLPLESTHDLYAHLPAAERDAVAAMQQEDWPHAQGGTVLQQLVRRIIGEHAARSLRVEGSLLQW